MATRTQTRARRAAAATRQPRMLCHPSRRLGRSVQVIVEGVIVLELSVFAAAIVALAWTRLEDTPTAIALGALIALIMTRCWAEWCWFARGKND